ncbi:hypothetical protein B0F89_13231 [Malaciobacter marinus]|jgi:hypothetical protein|uniref:Uncharacterized protein n=1 Tax=Malaciobacter marinus TaxID=505249 RepID=A0AB36ZSE6_9BACT|nr:hypothetical protein [Malaciobacter marinus]PPK59396.1 hypothetical protein B0F89_13231 [Malaciobacter marinus]
MQNKKIAISSIVKKIFVFVLIITPFTTILDSLSRTLISYTAVTVTPLYLSLLDDFLIFIIFLFLFLKLTIYLSNKTNFIQILKLNVAEYYYVMVLFFIIVSLIISSFFSPALIILSGLRSILFIFLIGLFMLFTQSDFLHIQKKTIPILIIFVYLNLALQALQAFSFANHFGPTLFGLSQRTIGFLKEPNALSLLNIFSLYFIHFYMENSAHKTLLVFVLLPVSLLLSGSITPIIGIFFVLLLYIFRFNFKLLLLIFPIAFLLIFLIIPELATRPGLMSSLLARLDIIINSATLNNIFFSTHFGYGTNTAVMLTGSTFIPESVIASLLVNIGLLGTLFFYILLFKIGINSKKNLVFVMLMGVASVTNVIFESSPVNLLFAFELAYLLKNQTKYLKSSNV